ncbi:MAG: HypC/HybG/HupF family hydrogenase formation chaperone [Anaerolineae bacterium]|nr:HypC/HybG/HupF family hydrogenase formation chaperone [Anaerolineae bacterium]
MCLAIPTLIKSIDGQQAEVEIGGVRRKISLALTPEAKVGDYVIVHTGFAISVLNEEEAQESLALFAELEESWATEEQWTDPEHEVR